MSFLDRQSTVAPPGYNRFLVPPAALALNPVGAVAAYAFTGTSAAAAATMATRMERRAMLEFLRYLPLPARRTAERSPPYRGNRTYRESRSR